MTWAKVCDTLHSHPKVLDADLEAMGLWIKALSHCAAYTTDGRVKRSAAVNLAGSTERADRLAADLLRAGLWEVHPSGDGWQVHDYLAFNPSRESVLRERDEGRSRAKASFERRFKKSSGEESTKNIRRASEASPQLQRPDPDPDPDPDPGSAKRAAPASPPLALAGDAPPSKAKRVREPKHTPEQIAGKNLVVDAFLETVKAKKGIQAKLTHKGEHAAAFALVKTYGAEDACAIVRRALADDFVLSKNCTLRYIASKPDTFRGHVVSKMNGRHMVQPPAPPGEPTWVVGDGT